MKHEITGFELPGRVCYTLVAGTVDEQDLVALHRVVTSRRRAAGARGGLAMANVA